MEEFELDDLTVELNLDAIKSIDLFLELVKRVFSVFFVF